MRKKRSRRVKRMVPKCSVCGRDSTTVVTSPTVTDFACAHCKEIALSLDELAA
jgi:endogenous inhibitor of DNA gyrase (YacG/DUF329 family)